MLLISVGVSGLEGGDCPLCSISGRSHPGSAEVVTTFSAQDVVIRWPEGVQAPVGCLFSRPSASFSTGWLWGLQGGEGVPSAFLFRLWLQLQRGGGASWAWGKGELQLAERGLGRIPGSPRTWAGPLFTPGKPVTEQTKAGPTFS